MLNMPYCSNEYIISHVVQKKLDVIKNYSDILAFDLCSKVYAFCISQFSYCKILRFQVAKGIGATWFVEWPWSNHITMDVIRIRSGSFCFLLIQINIKNAIDPKESQKCDPIRIQIRIRTTGPHDPPSTLLYREAGSVQPAHKFRIALHFAEATACIMALTGTSHLKNAWMFCIFQCLCLIAINSNVSLTARTTKVDVNNMIFKLAMLASK